MPVNLHEYRRSHDHRFHCPGVPEAEERVGVRSRLGSELQRVGNARPALSATDRAWTVMLYKQELISRDVAAKLLKALEGGGGEDYLKKALDGDEDAASAVNLGRTLQEPMSRLRLREKLLDVLDLTTTCLGTVLDMAEANVDTVMAGQTHLSHAQPTTYGAYLIAVHDGIARSLDLLELAYKHTNQNSAGCGACSGTGWPVDRKLVTELLGFDSVVEPTYDCEPGQDHALHILFALTSLGVMLTRTAMDFNIWGMEEVMMIDVDPSWHGVSSMMPQKSIPGSEFVRVRLEASIVIGNMITGVVSNKGEPYSDMLPIYEGWRGALTAMCHIEKALGFFNGLMGKTRPNRERMLAYAQEGFSASPDLVVKLIRDQGYGGRRAHRICATMVCIARERGIRACEATGELLDEAARITDEAPPGLPTEVVREMLDPVQFLERHHNLGDPHPDESRRMIGLRREVVVQVQQRHAERVAHVERAADRLAEEVAAIVGGGLGQ